MTLSIKCDELSKAIKKITGYEVEFECVNSESFKISKPITIPIFGKTSIGLEIKILGFDDTTLQIKAASDVLSKILMLMPSLDISKYATIEKDVIRILLGNIEELRKPLSYARPTSLRLADGAFHLEATLL